MQQFREFWPLYLRAHSKPATRAVHYAATVLGVGSTIAALITLQPAFLAGIPVAYGMAIATHRYVERNRSLVGVNALWGAVADLRMFWLALTGTLGRELAEHGIASKPTLSAWTDGRTVERSQ